MRKIQAWLPVVVALLVVLVSGAAAAPASAGIHYRSVTTTQDAANKTSEIEVEGWASGDKARVEFRESANPTAQAGTYMITKDGGKTLYLVDPKEKTYAVWDVDAMLGTLGGILQGIGPIVKFEFSEPKVEKLAEGDGGSVAGVPTRHYKYRTSYSMKVKVFGMGQANDIVSEQDIWAAELEDAGLGVWLRAAPRTGNPDLDRLIKSEMGKVQGFPLKSVTITTTTNKKGKQSTSRSTMEVTSFEKAAVAEDRFEIPPGYEETQVLPAAAAGSGQ